MPSALWINEANARLRASPEYAEWMRGQKIALSNVRLSDRQRTDFANFLRTRGWQIPKGVEIDKHGNINENEGFGKQAKRWGPVAAGAALTAFGIPGTGFGGLFGGGSAAAAGGAGAAAGGGLSWGKLGLWAGLPSLTQLLGAKMESGAITRGSEIEAESMREGLEEIKRQYDLDRSREEERYQGDVTAFAPYNQVGQRLVSRAGDMLDAYTPPPYMSVPIRDQDRGGRPAFTPPRGNMPGASMADLQRPLDLSQRPDGVWSTRPVPTRPTVLLEAPTGERRTVPAEQAEAYIRLGARRLN